MQRREINCNTNKVDKWPQLFIVRNLSAKLMVYRWPQLFMV